MKKLILLVLCAIIVSCNKQNNQPAQAAPPQNNPPSPTNTVTLNTQETQLAFDWKLYKQYSYNPTTQAVIINNTYNDPINCHLLLTSTTSTIFPNTSFPNNTLKGATNGIFNCNPITGLYWFIGNPNILTVGGTNFYIQTLTNDTLIITEGTSSNVYTIKFKLWK